jgi:hypothetical protein
VLSASAFKKPSPTTPRTVHARRVARHLPMLVLSLLLLAAWVAVWPFTIDDAYIVARYADRLAAGKGYTMNDGVVSDGVTGPLWLAPLTLAARLGFNPVSAAKLGGALASLVGALVLLRELGAGALGRRKSWLFVALLASSLPFVVWACAGLEGGLASLVLVLLWRAVRRRAAVSAGCALAALCWLRPEIVPMALAVAVPLLVGAPRAAYRAGAVALVGGLALVLFRFVMFDHVLPLSAHAKPALLAHGAAYVGRAVASPRGVLVALALMVAWRGSPRTRPLSVALLVHALALVVAGGDWMAGRRLFAPALPLLAWALAEGLARASLRSLLSRVLVAGLLLASTFELAPELARARAAGLLARARIPELARVICRRPGSIAMVDIGALGMACPTHTFVDLGGLVEADVAYAHGVHLDKRITPAWLEARAPSTLVLHSRERPRIDDRGHIRWFAGYPVERRVLTFPFVLRRYTVEQVLEYAHDYYYVVLVLRG